MLAEIATVDWDSLGVPQIPQWITWLLSTDTELRFRAYGKITDYIHDYTESPAYDYAQILTTDALVVTVPFFVDMLKTASPELAQIVLDILETMSRYQSEQQLPEEAKRRADRIYQIILASYDLYLPFLDSENRDTRVNVLYLLGSFAEKSEFFGALLLDRMQKGIEKDAWCRIIELEVMVRLLQANSLDNIQERFVKHGYTVIQFDPDLRLRAETAFHILKLIKEQVEDQAIACLIEAMQPENFIMVGADPRNWIDLLLEVKKEAVLMPLLNLLEGHPNTILTFKLAGDLMWLVLGDENRYLIPSYTSYGIGSNFRQEFNYYIDPPLSDPPATLTTAQQQVLKILLHKHEIWQTTSNLFDAFLLPNTPEGLEKLLKTAQSEA